MPFSVFDYQIEKPKEIRDSTQINFLVKSMENERVRLSSEHQNFVWVSRDDINQYNLSEAIKKVIQKAFEITHKLNVQT